MPNGEAIDPVKAMLHADMSAGWRYPAEQSIGLWGRDVGRAWPEHGNHEEGVHQDARRQLKATLEAHRVDGTMISVHDLVLRKLQWEFSDGGLWRLYGETMTPQELTTLADYTRAIEEYRGQTSLADLTGSGSIEESTLYTVESFHIITDARTALASRLGAPAVAEATAQT